MPRFLLSLTALGLGVGFASAQPAEPPIPTIPAAPVVTAEPVPAAVAALEPASPAARFWFTSEYLLWWTKGGSYGYPRQFSVNQNTVVQQGEGTTTFASSSAVAGIPGGDFGLGTRSGGRFTAGFWLDPAATVGVEGSYFFLARKSLTAGKFDLLENGILPRQIDDGGDEGGEGGNVNAEALPPGASLLDQTRVTQTLRLSNRLQGADVHLLYGLTAGPRWQVAALAGYRWLKFDERLEAVVTGVATPGPADPAFAVLSVAAPTSFTDTVLARTNFYGGQMGLRASGTFGRFVVSGDGKVSLGGVQELVRLSTDNPGQPATAVGPNSLFVTPQNAGEYSRTRFAVVSEVDASLGYRVTDRVQVSVGYALVYLNHVARAGDQVDTSNSGLPVTVRDSSYWAQGITFGASLRY